MAVGTKSIPHLRRNRWIETHTGFFSFQDQPVKSDIELARSISGLDAARNLSREDVCKADLQTLDRHI